MVIKTIKWVGRKITKMQDTISAMWDLRLDSGTEKKMDIRGKTGEIQIVYSLINFVSRIVPWLCRMLAAGETW